MRIDFATLAFGYRVKSGGNTPNWATALGQGNGYRINNNPEINEILKGMVYSSASLEKITTKIGKGGKVVAGNLWDDAFKFNREVIFETTEYRSLESVIRAFMYAEGIQRFKMFKQNVVDALQNPDSE